MSRPTKLKLQRREDAPAQAQDETPQREDDSYSQLEYAVKRIDGVNGIHFQVEWKGASEALGTVSLQTAEGWEDINNLAPDNPDQDSIVCPEVSGDNMPLFFARGPNHSDVAFKVKAVPVYWIIDAEDIPEHNDPDWDVRRDRDYVRIEDPNDVAWQSSTMNGDDVQRAQLSLPIDSSFEVWVSMRSPEDGTLWRDHDPVVTIGSPPVHPT